MAETFTPTELVSIYRQAKDKKKQLRIIKDLTGIRQDEEVTRMLLDAGLSSKELPRAPRGAGKKIDPDTISAHESDDPVFDAVCANLGLTDEPEEPTHKAEPDLSALASLPIVPLPATPPKRYDEPSWEYESCLLPISNMLERRRELLAELSALERELQSLRDLLEVRE